MRPHIRLAGRWNARSASGRNGFPPPRIFAQSWACHRLLGSGGIGLAMSGPPHLIGREHGFVVGGFIGLPPFAVGDQTLGLLALFRGPRHLHLPPIGIRLAPSRRAKAAAASY